MVAYPDAPTWSKQLGLSTYTFQNPLRQNFKHVKAIQQLLDFIPVEHIHALVVCTGTATFRTSRPQGVVDILGLVQYVRRWTVPVLTVQEMEHGVGRLECQRKRLSRRTDVEHHAYVTRKFGDVP